jgi:mRNA interferase RelE/StbE
LFIMAWIRKNLDGCTDPRIHGKGLTANRSGEWRYRVGDYRLLAKIQDDKLIILVLTVGHRRDVYK